MRRLGSRVNLFIIQYLTLYIKPYARDTERDSRHERRDTRETYFEPLYLHKGAKAEKLAAGSARPTAPGGRRRARTWA